MVIYSNSRLSTFEQCPLKYRFRYIEKIPSQIQSIESHLGSIVHDSLEWLYLEVKKGDTPAISELIEFYSKKWEEDYNPETLIVNHGLAEEDYFNKGVKFLIDYYVKNKPFDDNTLEVEKEIITNLDQGGDYKIQGFIDRLVHNLKTGEYEIHDYKTANNLPLQEKINGDRQLALYAIAIRELYGKDKKICLVWHYLAHNKRICSRRTDEQLNQLKEDTIELIKKIESTANFHANKTVLCSWCEYKSICPKFNREAIEKQENLDKHPKVIK